MEDKTILLVLYLLAGVLLVLLSIPLHRQRITPNGLYGFRVKKTMENPEIWYAVNKHFSIRLFWTGISTILAAVILYFIPSLSLDAYALSCLAIFILVFGVGIAQSVIYMQKL